MTNVIALTAAPIAALPIAALAWGALQEWINPTPDVDDEGTVECENT